MTFRNPFADPRPRGYFVAALVLILTGIVIGLGVSANLGSSKNPASQTVALAASTAAIADQQSPFVAVVERALPAVVFIDVRKKAAGGGSSGDAQEDFFRRFFGEGGGRQPRVAPSSGSGFIIDESGHILTNNHVVRDASDITVTLNDRRTFKAKVVGADPETDVAVIQIEGSNLPVLPLGDSQQLRVGDWAIAIGNPLGQLRGSVTVGIVSAQGRTDLNIFGGTPTFQDFIQTDASINFGNSGGPLCNIRGEAIGINTAINTSGQGIGFAIPINLAKHVADQLMASGKVQRAWLGVSLAELTPELAEGFGMNSQEGILVQEVLPGTPAERAGLKRNDIIVEFDGKSVSDVPKFRLRVADTEVGSRIPVTILRDNKRMVVTVTLSERNSEALAQARPATPAPEEAQGAAGLKVRNLTDEERQALSGGSQNGVVVAEVEEGSAAEEVGLQVGDIIEQVGGQPVRDAATFTRMVKDARPNRKHAALLVQRNGQSRFVALRIAD